jgi:hypothetical protein
MARGLGLSITLDAAASPLHRVVPLASAIMAATLWNLFGFGVPEMSPLIAS